MQVVCILAINTLSYGRMRLTTHRQEILDLLSHSSDLKSAAAVHEALPHINLVTIYRALEALSEAGLVKKIILSDEEALYEVQHEPHHHALCSTCGTVIHFTTDDIALKNEFRIPGFSIDEVSVTVHGHCKKHAT